MYNEPMLIKKKNHNKKPLMLVFTIVMFLGISFAAAYFVSNQSDTRVNKLVSGLIDIEFTNQTENIYLSEDKAVPMMDSLGKQNPPYEFTVKNISKVPIRVYIALDIKSITIDKSALRYALYINNEEVITSDLSKLDESNNLYTLENLDPSESITGKIVFWIDYYYEEVNQTFDATIKVTGESKDYIYEKKTYATDTLKEKLGTGGLVGIPTTCSEESCEPITDKSADKSTIREYRYVGATANNYVTFNDEKWRIIGIFKDAAGQEHMKIVRNGVLPASAMPDTYTVSGQEFNIRYNSGATAYWNSTRTGTNYNDWTTAGLKYWLNSEGTTDGYLKSLTGTAQNMIYEAKWYLGNFKYGSSGDDTVTAYEHERGSTTCSGSCSGGDVWSGNEATWTGKIALMYPSDYGYSADSSYWSGTILYSYNSAAKDTSWLYKEANHSTSTSEWLLSPFSGTSYIVARWTSDGYVDYDHANNRYGARPALYLKSTVTINGGEGTSTSPFTLTS